MIKREEYMKRIRPFIGKDVIKVLTGLRRSGKSVMLDLIQEELLDKDVLAEQFITYNFEDLRHRHLLTAESLHAAVLEQVEALDGLQTYIFLDEIQEVAEWERVVNSLRVSVNCDIYITGSNANLLSSELATHLAGRYVEFVIYPFSFREFKDSYEDLTPPLQLPEGRSLFMEYIDLGGMPYLGRLAFDHAASQIYLRDLFNSAVLKDVVSRNEIRDVDLLERILAYTFVHTGNEFSASSISRFFKSEGRTVARETILNYLSYCVDAFLLYQVKKFDIQGKRMLAVNEKFYIADHGIREAVLGGKTRDINLILENIIYLELLRRDYKVTVGRVGDLEVDFVAEKQDKRLYLQVSYLLASPETIEREFRVFDKIKDHHTKMVLSLDSIDMSRDGIRHESIPRFLLSDDW